MGLAPGRIEEIDHTLAQPDSTLVRAQLDRLLAHPLFSNSKRYPALLAYVVEQTLLGNAVQLKERTIGVEVFGRQADYDANSDPVVRITAGEVRKRLSQYYYDPAHDGEPVIELPVGSYIPIFSLRQPAPVESGQPDPVPAAEDSPRQSHAHWVLVAGIALMTAILGAALGYTFKPAATAAPPSNIDRFWEPVTSSLNPATFCIGEPAKRIDIGAIGSFDAPNPVPDEEPASVPYQDTGGFALSDVITLTRSAAALEARHKTFRVVPASLATFAQLREGPIILIGAFDNIWTLRITHSLRFDFELRNGVRYLVDRAAQKPTSWTTVWDKQHEKLERDYAVVARIHDKTTGQPVIIVAGISEKGTEAAGEIIYNPVYLKSLLARIPQDWENKNLEAVIETQVIQGHSGPPSILAVESW